MVSPGDSSMRMPCGRISTIGLGLALPPNNDLRIPLMGNVCDQCWIGSGLRTPRTRGIGTLGRRGLRQPVFPTCPPVLFGGQLPLLGIGKLEVPPLESRLDDPGEPDRGKEAGKKANETPG